MGNICAINSAREIIVKILFLSQRMHVMTENARSPSSEELSADRRFYEGHDDTTQKGRLVHTANRS